MCSVAPTPNIWLRRHQIAKSVMLVRSIYAFVISFIHLYHREVGVYANSGLSGYTVAEGSLPTNNTILVGSEGPNFPVTWNPRYAIAVSVTLTSCAT